MDVRVIEVQVAGRVQREVVLVGQRHPRVGPGEHVVAVGLVHVDARVHVQPVGVDVSDPGRVAEDVLLAVVGQAVREVHPQQLVAANPDERTGKHPVVGEQVGRRAVDVHCGAACLDAHLEHARARRLVGHRGQEPERTADGRVDDGRAHAATHAATAHAAAGTHRPRRRGHRTGHGKGRDRGGRALHEPPARDDRDHCRPPADRPGRGSLNDVRGRGRHPSAGRGR